MVDRYYLPVPKSIMLGSYVVRKDYRKFTFVIFFSGLLISLQIGRLTNQRVTYSKPAGYFVDWGSPDAPKKVKFY